MKKTVIVVDMNNGFCKEGALHDTGILKIVPAIIQQLKQVAPQRRIFITDSHSEGAKEFQDYPVHCLTDSSESAIIEELVPYMSEEPNEFQIPGLVKKNATNAAWAADMKVQAICENSDEIIITGCCTDICILQFALSIQTYLNEHNLPCRLQVPQNCVATFHIPEVHDAEQYHHFALQLMKNAGISI